MKKCLLVLGISLIILCSCGGGLNPAPSQSTANLVDNASVDDVHQEPVIFPTGSYEPQFGDIGAVFSLTAAQQDLYDAYVKDFNFDVSILNGASPTDVAQVYVECGLDGLWEGEYNLFYFESSPFSKISYKEEFEKDMATADIRTRRDMANLVFPYLKDGKFVDLGGDSGYIEFKSLDQTDDYENYVEVTMKMNLKKEGGIWKININNLFVTD